MDYFDSVTIETWWVKLLIVFFTSGTGVAAIRWAKWYKTNKASNKLRRTYVAITEIYTILTSIISATNVSRALIVRSENGGGIPSPGKQIYASVIYEVTTNKIPSVRHRWQRQPIDKQYAKLLSDVFANNHIAIDTKNMDEGNLRDLYLADKALSSEVFKIGISEVAMLYLEVHFFKEVMSPSDIAETAQRDYIRASITRLRIIFQENGEIFHHGN